MKPLKDWTLEEVYNECRSRQDCEGCRFIDGGNGCGVNQEPFHWGAPREHTKNFIQKFQLGRS